MPEKEPRFEFGSNWQSFVAGALNDARIKSATDALKRLLPACDFSGKTFLDIGCGSGLSSLSAFLLGAEKVISFDYDKNSVSACESLRDKMGVPTDKWEIMQGSILDVRFMASLPEADVVYSWGVLHHTGNMWMAIDAAAAKVKSGGLFSIAIYNEVPGRKGSSMWLKIKKTYNTVPAPLKSLMLFGYTSYLLLRMAVTLRNPIKYMANYSVEAGRGMSFQHDTRDWLGGYPFEYASAGGIFNHIHEQTGMRLIYLNTRDGHFCNELSFINQR